MVVASFPGTGVTTPVVVVTRFPGTGVFEGVVVTSFPGTGLTVVVTSLPVLAAGVVTRAVVVGRALTRKACHREYIL